jgi:hypothetical protein
MPFLARFLALLALATPILGQAPERTWHLNIQTYSFHPDTDEQYLHNTTPGIGLIRRHGEWFEGAGIFRNSIGRWAGYGYLGWQRAFYQTRAGAFRLGAIAGLTHHYHFNDGGIVPLAAAVLTIPVTKTIGIDLVTIPRVHSAVYTAVNVSLSWRFR